MDRLTSDEMSAKDGEIKYLKGRVRDLESVPKHFNRGKLVFVFCVFFITCLLKEHSEDLFSYAIVFWMVQGFLVIVANWIWSRNG